MTRGSVGERGLALPMALMCLALLAPLMLALASLSVSEPVIAGNQLRASQARVLADSGLEYALWALSTPAALGGLPSPLPGPSAPAPFDGRTFVPLGLTGGFTVQVAPHASGDAQRRTITAIGRAEGGRAHRQVVADAVAIPRLAARAPCALCVRGALGVSGNVAIDGGNGDPACGADTRYGAFTRDATTVAGAASFAGGAGGLAQHQPAADFDAVTLSPGALDALRALALRSGTYYGPGFPRGGAVSDGRPTWDGRVVFDAATPLPDGIVFVDATDGRNVTPGGATDTLAVARLESGAFASPDGVFRGWIVVNGALDIAAGLRLRGLVYTVDTITVRGSGAGSLAGLAIAHNARGTAAQLEPATGGSLGITFDCAPATAPGLIPPGWTLIPGTYREEHD